MKSMNILHTLLDKFQGVIEAAIPTVVLLGILIFVHELGHFLVAKYNKVRVETFSLGFGPKLIKYKWGDTTYCLSLIPLGGYVKMFGDDPTAVISEEDKQHSFTHKTLKQKTAIVLAGPFTNFFFAILVYTVMAVYGEQAISPIVGDIDSGSAAATAGFKPGDTIVSIAQSPIKTWEEIDQKIEDNGGQKVAVDVLREGSKEKATLNVTPQTVSNKNVLSWDENVGEVSGLSFYSKVSFIGVSDSNSLAYTSGLRTGDLVVEVQGQKVDKWRTLAVTLASLAHTQDKISLKVEHDAAWNTTEKEMPTSIVEISIPQSMKNLDGAAFTDKMGIEAPEVFLAELEKDSPAFKAGMQRGDKILSIDGKEVKNFDAIAASIQAFSAEKSKALNIVVSRDGKDVKIPVQPVKKERASIHGKEEVRYEIGIKPLISTTQSTFTLSATNPVNALKRGLFLTGKWTSATVLSFVRLAQARISPKNIGGFFSIGMMAKRSWQIGLAQFLSTMGILSLNLFILNLLPIPVLDGGHLLFYTIEAAKGSPLSLKKMEMAQQVGMLLLLGLMVFALFNDITRMLL